MSPWVFDPRNEGFWGDTTSTLDWCERNYEVTWYVAELWNTVTNLSMIVPPLYGIHHVLKNNLEKRFLLSFLGLLMVGVGSTLFHMTLRYSMQLMDEIPMVWSSCAFLYCLFMVRSDRGEQGLILMTSLLLYAILFTIIYSFWTDPIVHQAMYGVLVFLMLFQAANILKQDFHLASAKIFAVAILMYGGAFFLWNIDNIFCGQIEEIRKDLPSLLKPLTQLHGWWHIFAGYATFLNIQFCVFYRLKHLKEQSDYGWDWVGLVIDVAGSGKKQ